MTVKVSSIGLKGLEGYLVQEEVKISTGTESMTIVGLPDASVKESRERVLSSISHFEADVTDKKVVVNLSPSEQKKSGPIFDLAIAVAVLKELQMIKENISTDTAFIGALSLEGAIVKVEGMLPALISAKKLGLKKVYLPYDSTIPLQMLQDINCVIVQHLEEVVQHLDGQELLFSPPPPEKLSIIKNSHSSKDFCHIIGHEHPKRALEIAAAGEHNAAHQAVVKVYLLRLFLLFCPL